MNDRIKNPHTFDMSNYYSGMTCVLGGRDFEREEKEAKKDSPQKENQDLYELDWSFLKNFSNPQVH